MLRHNQLKQTSILDPRELSIREMVWELKYDLQRMDELDGTNDFKNLLSDWERGSDAVSYTHLTLPTIYSV